MRDIQDFMRARGVNRNAVVKAMRGAPSCVAAVSSILLLLGPVSIGRGADESQITRDVKEVIQTLSSESCRVRWAGQTAFLQGLDDYGPRLQALRDTVKSGDPSVQAIKERISMVIEYLRQVESSLARLEPEKQADRIGPMPPGRRRSSELLKLRKQLLGMINDPKEDFIMRLHAAIFMTESAHSLTAAWAKDTTGLLQSSDPTVRLVGSLLAAERRLLKSQAPEKGSVIPMLIRGLSRNSYAERWRSQAALLRVTAQPLDEFCVDPTDPSAVRAISVQRWDEWWANNKDSLAGEKISQPW